MRRKPREELERIFKNELSACVKCGSCMSFCPIFRQGKNEASNMRGKLAILQALESGRRIPDKEVEEILGTCLSCQSCRKSCPNGVNTTLATFLGKVLLPSKGPYGLTGRALVLKYQVKEIFLPVLIWGPKAIFRGSFLREIFQKLRELVLGSQEPEIIKFNQTVPGKNVLIFPGCHFKNDSFRLARLERVFQSLGFHALVARDHGCCGIPAAQKFDLDAHEKLSRTLLRNLTNSKADTILFLCPECLFQIKSWPHLYQMSEQEKQLIKKIVDPATFFEQLDFNPRKKIQGSFTFHDPCAQIRGLGLKSAPRKLLQKLLAKPLSESFREGACCGFGNGLTLSNPELSLRIRNEQIGHLQATGANTILTSCRHCQIMLEGPPPDSGREVPLSGENPRGQVTQLLDILCEAMGE